jgi:hypothetical protein
LTPRPPAGEGVSTVIPALAKLLAENKERTPARVAPSVGCGTVTSYLRAALPPAALAASARAVVRTGAPEAALGDVRTLERQRDLLLGNERLLGRSQSAVEILPQRNI